MPEIFKKLGEFFDYERFMRGKTVEVDGIEPWKDFNTPNVKSKLQKNTKNF